MGDMTKNFSRKEFACKCGCGEDGIEAELVRMLQVARCEAEAPLTINSGCRCEAHNAASGSKPTSSHIKGLAVDIRAATPRKREQMLWALMQAGFNRLGIHAKFIHADIDTSKPPDVVWLYG
jgi:uncharacterized protein YcbK (DUF882 family)